MAGSGFLRCEQVVWFKGSWWECGYLANYVTFPRTPPMSLCPQHERGMREAKASCVRATETAPPAREAKGDR